jgi:hypothetical protein
MQMVRILARIAQIIVRTGRVLHVKLHWPDASHEEFQWVVAEAEHRMYNKKVIRLDRIPA